MLNFNIFLLYCVLFTHVKLDTFFVHLNFVPETHGTNDYFIPFLDSITLLISKLTECRFVKDFFVLVC